MKKIIFLVFALGLMTVLAACGPSGATPNESGELMIIQIDEEGGMRFDPGSVVLTAGQPVRIILENKGTKNHEFMIGRNVVRMADGAANGFETDFFEGITDLVKVTLGDGSMLMVDGETVMMGGMDMGSGDEHSDSGGDEHAMDHMGWMVMSEVGSGTTVIEFTVPEDKVGEWEMACFEDNGSHYEDGMRGTLTVVKP